jgi:hypothetical protein
MRTYKGYDGDIELHDDHLVIRREGFAAKASGRGSGSREIPIAAVSDVTLKPATMAVNGSLQLQLGGDPPGDRLKGDPNTVVFRRKSAADFEELASLLKEQIVKNVAAGIDPSTIEVDRGTSRLDRLEEKRRAAEKRLEEADKRQEEERRAAGKPDAKLSLGFTSIKLHEDRVESPWGSGSLEGAQARIDSRGWRGQKTYVIIEGPHVAIARKLSSNSGVARKAAERFVAQVNSAAQRLGPVTSSGVNQPDSLDQLEKLGKLRDSGVISDEEFEAKKAELLKRL